MYSLALRLHKLSIDAQRVLSTVDPLVLGDYLLHLNDDDYATREPSLEGIRLLPRREGFETHLEHWAMVR